MEIAKCPNLDPMVVVNGNFQVYSIPNLLLIDAVVFPLILLGNINRLIMTIALLAAAKVLRYS